MVGVEAVETVAVAGSPAPSDAQAAVSLQTERRASMAVHITEGDASL